MPPKEGEIIRRDQEGGSTETSQTLTLLAQKIFGADKTPPLSSEQIDKFIEQRGTIISYVHEDKMQESWDSKFYLVVILIFILAFAGGVAWKLPDYFGEVLSFVAGLFGGSLGGYGLAKIRS